MPGRIFLTGRDREARTLSSFLYDFAGPLQADVEMEYSLDGGPGPVAELRKGAEDRLAEIESARRGIDRTE